MKKFIIQQVLEAEPMPRKTAEERMKREIDSTEDSGFLTCDLTSLQFDWIGKPDFKGRPFDSPIERMFFLHDRLPEWIAFFRQHTKNNAKMSQDERLQVYLINRHLKALDQALNKILNIHTLNTSSL